MIVGCSARLRPVVVAVSVSVIAILPRVLPMRRSNPSASCMPQASRI